MTYHSPQLDTLLADFPKAMPWDTSNRILIPVYLGTRHASNGLKRFIAVYTLVSRAPASSGSVALFLLNRPTGFCAPESTGQNVLVQEYGCDLGLHAVPNFVVNSAAEDPNDKSHFTMSFDAYDAQYIENFFLQPNGSILVNEQVLEWVGANASPLPGRSPTRTFSGSYPCAIPR